MKTFVTFQYVMRSVLLFVAILCLAILSACSESFSDPRDGNTYKVIHAGSQIWMAENLAYETEGSYCPAGDSRNCSKYGRLYAWEAARGACPDGWRLPDSTDFAGLVELAGGPAVAGEALKSTGGWFKKGNGTDALGFDALPAGYRAAGEGEENSAKYDGIGGYAYFWSASEDADGLAYYLFLDFSNKSAGMNAFPKSDARSVRCVKKAD